jgi:arylsulfatase
MVDRGASREDFKGTIGTTAKQSEPWWPERPSAPAGAPNVVVIMLDDTGFAQLGCYGSDIETPNIDRLAAGGLRYNNFHTTALCSPTRACLLSGRNHHSVGMRFLSNVDTGYSNCRGYISNKAAILPEILRSHGYNTFALGKWHLTNMEDVNPAGPFDQWPLQRGFDRYYGFLGGATDQFAPELVSDNQPLNPPSEDGYHVSEDLVDQAIGMIGAQQSTAQGRPFFTYLAFGATHSPHQAPKQYLDKYRGRYDKGWDETRAAWFARQKALGIVPAETELSPRNPGIDAWRDLSEGQKRVYARMQEAFAAFLDHTDDQIGRLIDFLEQLDVLDNTLVILLSDNGASQEGGQDGSLNELIFFNRLRPTIDEMVQQVDDIGGPKLYNNYPKGWAQVGNTPLRFYKQNTYEGGIRDPLIVHWPARIKDAGNIRTQYHHAIDLLPTILGCVGVEAPESFNGLPQLPVEGISMGYSFSDPDAEGRRRVQYYEMLGHRAVWADGWKAVTMHKEGTDFDDDIWHLYNTDVDLAECKDLAESNPQKLQQMISMWWAEAGKFNVLPLDDRTMELFVMRRPTAAPTNQIRLRPGLPRLNAFATPNIRDRSYQITAQIDRADTSEEGALVACGARTGGYALYIQGNHLFYEYNFVGRPTVIKSNTPLPAGACSLGMRFEKNGRNMGVVTLLLDGTIIGEGELEMLPWRQSLMGLDVGADRGFSISPAYASPFEFQGTLHFVDYDLGDDQKNAKTAAKVEARNALVDQ